MKITPLDIDQQQFSVVFRGNDPDEVRAFLNQVSRELEELNRDNLRLKDEMRRLESQVEEFREHEAQLREALSSAGRMTGEIKETAKKEAALIKAEAELEAEKIVSEARNDLARLSEESRSLRLQKTRLLTELRTVLESHRRLLETQEELDKQSSSGRSRPKSQNGQGSLRR